MFKILKKTQLAPQVFYYLLHAPDIAKKALPGQFVIIRLDETGERIPITISDFDPIDENTPSIDEPYVAPGPGTVISHYNLRTNDCFDREEQLVSGQSLITTTRLPCDEPHRFQVFAQLEYPAEHPSVYPGDDVMEDFALLSCYRHFEPWVDAVYETSELEISVLTPNQIDFEDDMNHYRGIHCAVHRLDGDRLTGTARSSGL